MTDKIVSRKTKKYYRDIIYSNYDSAVKILKEAVKKYGLKGYKKGDRKTQVNVSNNWNGWIKGFIYNYKTDSILVDCYWQGDITDGNDYIEFKGKEITIPRDESHSSVSFNKNILYEAMKQFANIYLK